MKLDQESSKPLMLEAGRPVSLAEAVGLFPELAAGYLGSGPKWTRKAHYIIASEALQRLKRQANSATRKLVESRLRAIPNNTFRFLDGRIFTGTEAADAIAEGRPEGDYFYKLEKRALEIVLQALSSGDHDL